MLHSQIDPWSPSFRCTQGQVCAICMHHVRHPGVSILVEGGRPLMWANGVTLTVVTIGSTICQHAMMNVLLRGLFLALQRPTGLLVNFILWLWSLSAVVTLPYWRKLVQRLWWMSSVSDNLLAGSTRVRGPTTGDCFSLLCLVLLNMRNIFIYNDT